MLVMCAVFKVRFARCQHMCPVLIGKKIELLVDSGIVLKYVGYSHIWEDELDLSLTFHKNKKNGCSSAA